VFLESVTKTLFTHTSLHGEWFLQIYYTTITQHQDTMEWGPCVGPTSLCLSVVLCECFNHFSPYTPTLSHEVSECVIRSFFFFFLIFFQIGIYAQIFVPAWESMLRGPLVLDNLECRACLFRVDQWGITWYIFLFFLGITFLHASFGTQTLVFLWKNQGNANRSMHIRCRIDCS
jgi:hypothetical protein